MRRGTVFTDPIHQIKQMRELNALGWGIAEEVFDRASQTIPREPKRDLVARVLVPYFPASDGSNGAVQTFRLLLAALRRQAQGSVWTWYGFAKGDTDYIRLAKGVSHPLDLQTAQPEPVRGTLHAPSVRKTGLIFAAHGPMQSDVPPKGAEPMLRWEVIDLGSFRGARLKDVRSSRTSPHAGILAAAVLHPSWIRGMNGRDVPYVWLPGYEVCTSTSMKWPWWTSVPTLRYNDRDREIILDQWWLDRAGDDSWSVPTFFLG